MKNDVSEIANRVFIVTHADKFERFLKQLDEPTRHLIRKEKQLNELYDLFLDFIIDANQHLEVTDIKEQENKLDVSSIS